MSLSRTQIFPTQTAALLPTAICVPRFLQALSAPGESVVRIKFNPSQTLAIIPPDFVGLGYEISSVAHPGLLSSNNAVLVQLVQTLGKQGVIRVGEHHPTTLPTRPTRGLPQCRRAREGRWSMTQCCMI